MMADKVLAEMLTVPAHALCSCEHEIVTGGSCSTGVRVGELLRDHARDDGVCDQREIIAVLLET